MSMTDDLSPGKTTLRRIEQHRDRWSSHGSHTGIITLSDCLTPGELREFEIFQEYDARFLEKISPDVSVCIWDRNATLFEEGSYLDLAFFIVNGEVEVALNRAAEMQPIFDDSRTSILPMDGTLVTNTAQETPADSRLTRGIASDRSITFLASMDFDLPRGAKATLGPGELFGEIGALSGWPQSVTARTVGQCRLVQIRIPALRLMKRKSVALKARLDKLYRERTLFSQLKTTPLFRACSDVFLNALKEAVELVSYEPGGVVFTEGQLVDALYLVRSGFIKLSQRFGQGEVAVSYLSKGMTLGEVELLLSDVDRGEVTASSVEYSELVKIPRKAVDRLLRDYPDIQELLWRSAASRIKETGHSKRNMAHAEFTQVALDRGLMQGNSILVIDLERCTRCDDCVRGCAATHGGRPRFVREGDKYDNLLVAKSCYHCRDPVCLVGCPTGAIHRAGVRDVVEIAEEICIGCGTCANNCPYDAIVMHDTGKIWPEDMVPTGLRGNPRQVASKCNLCHDTGHGPACVSNCPQGCAYRVGSLEEFRDLLKTKD